MSRLRTIHACAVEIHEIDSASGISEYFIRNGVRDGSIPSITIGANGKRLVDLDYLLNLDPAQVDQKINPLGVRRIPER